MDLCKSLAEGFQYPLIGSIGCNRVAQVHAVCGAGFQYPLIGSIGCNSTERTGEPTEDIVSVSSNRIDRMQPDVLLVTVSSQQVSVSSNRIDRMQLVRRGHMRVCRGSFSIL
jgi:hypothetical protein